MMPRERFKSKKEIIKHLQEYFGKRLDVKTEQLKLKTKLIHLDDSGYDRLLIKGPTPLAATILRGFNPKIDALFDSIEELNREFIRHDFYGVGTAGGYLGFTDMRILIPSSENAGHLSLRPHPIRVLHIDGCRVHSVVPLISLEREDPLHFELLRSKLRQGDENGGFELRIFARNDRLGCAFADIVRKNIRASLIIYRDKIYHEGFEYVQSNRPLIGKEGGKEVVAKEGASTEMQISKSKKVFRALSEDEILIRDESRKSFEQIEDIIYELYLKPRKYGRHCLFSHSIYGHLAEIITARPTISLRGAITAAIIKGDFDMGVFGFAAGSAMFEEEPTSEEGVEHIRGSMKKLKGPIHKIADMEDQKPIQITLESGQKIIIEDKIKTLAEIGNEIRDLLFMKDKSGNAVNALAYMP
jgi:hypothetical protein